MAAKANLAIILGVQGQSAVEGALKGIMGAAKSMVDGLGKIGLAGMGLSALAEGAKGLGDALGVGLASDLSESMSKVNTVLGDSDKLVAQFAATSATAFGISKAEAYATAGSFGNLFKTMGLGQDAAATMSVDITKLGADLASFHNIAGSDALEKLQAGLVGEAEPLRALGVLLTEDSVALKAVEMGLAKTTKEVSESAKVQARYALIVAQTKDAQGDFARTSTGLANSQRIIAAGFQDIQTSIGQQLLPVIAPLVSQFAAMLPGALAALQPHLAAFGATILTVAGLVAEWVPALQQAFDFFRTGGGDIEKFRGVLNAALGPEATQGIIAGFAQITGTVQSLIKAFSEWQPALQQAFGFFVTGTGDVEKFRGVLNAAVGPEAAKVIVGGFASITSVIHDDLLPLLGRIGEAIRPSIDAVREFVASGRAMETVTAVADGLRAGLGALGAAVQSTTKFFADNQLATAGLVGIVTALTVAKGLATAAAVAHTLATQAATIATNVMAGAQAALNLILSANPIGLVVVALAGLTAALVYAYNNSDEFRAAVDGAWEAVKTAAAVVASFVADNLPKLQAALGLVTTKAGEVKDGVAAIVTGLGSMIDFIAGTFAAAIDSAVNSGAFRALLNVLATIQHTIDTIWEGWKKLKDSIANGLPSIPNPFGGGAGAGGGGGGGARGVGGTVITGNSVYVTAPDSRAAGYAAADGLASLARSRVLSGAL